jgi:eukaryotic-like serine/threonine-protein kinase
MFNSQDELLARLLAEMTEAARRGEPVEVESIACDHPELAAELRELWGAALIADELGRADLPGDGGLDSWHERPQAATADSAGNNGIPSSLGEYELVEEIGRGGMGVVYRARQASLGRVVALKMISQAELASPADRSRFRAEAAAAGTLDHPHIVPVYEVGESDGRPYFSMKYIGGTTLARRLSEGPLTARQTAELLLPACRAVAYAHERGIVHRDLKPSNILIDEQGQPHITDFGLAKRIPTSVAASARRGEPAGEETAPPSEVGMPQLTRTGAILGTPSYMSPEQAAGSRGIVGPASDVYSLGAILYTCLTGRPPFQAASPLDVVMMVLEQEPVLPQVLNPKADLDLQMIALKCLQKPPELRYRSAAALADDLAAYLANEPISARSTNITQLISRILRETHHAVILENWGLLWMWHSLVLLVLCVTTNWFQWRGIESRLPYLGLWVVGLGAWAAFFWNVRRRAGPITFVERQIAHVWGASMIASCLLFAVETLLGMNVLTLSPVLPLIGASVFVVKAGILSGSFYIQSVALFGTALTMAWLRRENLPDFGLTLYGAVSAVSFFVPGLKYWRQQRRMHE